MIKKYGKGLLDKDYNIFSLKHRLHIVAKIAVYLNTKNAELIVKTVLHATYAFPFIMK
jgi:hypothetical protein